MLLVSRFTSSSPSCLPTSTPRKFGTFFSSLRGSVEIEPSLFICIIVHHTLSFRTLYCVLSMVFALRVGHKTVQCLVKHLPKALSHGSEGHSVARVWEERASCGRRAPGVCQVLVSYFSIQKCSKFQTTYDSGPLEGAGTVRGGKEQK